MQFHFLSVSVVCSSYDKRCGVLRVRGTSKRRVVAAVTADHGLHTPVGGSASINSQRRQW